MFLLGEMENSVYLASKMSQVINMIVYNLQAPQATYLVLATCRN